MDNLPPIPEYGFDVASGVSASTGEPLVEVRLNTEHEGAFVSVPITLAAEEAVAVGLSLITAAASARSDAALISVFRARGQEAAGLAFLAAIRGRRDGEPPQGRDT